MHFSPLFTWRLLVSSVLLAAAILIAQPSGEAASPSGRWRGTWTSQSTGHAGALRARIRRVDSQTYRALFAGRFAKVIPFVYPAKLTRVPGTWNRYQSRTRLPILGEYRMEASVTARRFDATFRGKKDVGRFLMTR